MADNNVSADRVRELLSYDAASGVFSWAMQHGQKCKKGAIAGGVNKQTGYVVIRLDRRIYKAHRLAWLWVNGSMPSGEVDHINGMRNDNRIVNLRAVSRSGNSQNQRRARSDNKSGFLGVSWRCRSEKWRASISADGRRYELGLFSTPEAAHDAYLIAKRKLHATCEI